MADKSVSTESLGVTQKTAYTGKKFRVAMVGCGGISKTHMNALLTMDDVEVVAGVDIEPFKLDAFKNQWGVEKLYTDWNQMLAEVKPDGVDICTPNGVHRQPAIDALNAGAHVICEKPMAMNPAECQAMIDAAEKNNRTFTIGFQYRYHPNTQFLKRAADAGTFGDIMFVRCQALRRRGIPNWGVFGQKHLQGGGPMIDIGVHVIEMAHYVMGRPKPVAATGNVWTYLGDKSSDVVSMWPNWDYKTYTVEDQAIGHVTFDNGAIMHIEAMFAGHIEKDVWNFQLNGTKGGCTWDPAMVFEDRAGSMINSTPAFLPPTGDFPNMFRAKLRTWVDAAVNGGPNVAAGEDGLNVQKILDGIYRSAANGGKEVKID